MTDFNSKYTGLEVEEKLDMIEPSTSTDFGVTKIGTSVAKANGTASAGSTTGGLAASVDHVHPAQATISGNAGTATKLSSAKTIAFTGGITGSVSSDFGGNVTIPTTLTPFDASKISSGVISIDRLPKGALERLIPVVNDAARFALTADNAQEGDTVHVASSDIMYLVIDQTKLNTEAGYRPYTAASATAVPWSGVTGKPTTLSGYGITDGFKTSRKLWGQTLGGDGDVKGSLFNVSDIYMGKNNVILIADSSNVNRAVMALDPSNALTIGYGTTLANNPTYLCGGSLVSLNFKNPEGTGTFSGFSFHKDYLLGIGTTSPAANIDIYSTLNTPLQVTTSYAGLSYLFVGKNSKNATRFSIIENNTSVHLQYGGNSPVADIHRFAIQGIDGARLLKFDVAAKESVFSNDVIAGGTIESLTPNGTPPLKVASNTVVSNLNADLLDGYNAKDFTSFSNQPIDLNVVDKYIHYAAIGATDNYPTLLGGNTFLVISSHPTSNNGGRYAAQLAFGFGSDYLGIRRKGNTTVFGPWNKISAGNSDTVGGLVPFGSSGDSIVKRGLCYTNVTEGIYWCKVGEIIDPSFSSDTDITMVISLGYVDDTKHCLGNIHLRKSNNDANVYDYIGFNILAHDGFDNNNIRLYKNNTKIELWINCRYRYSTCAITVLSENSAASFANRLSLYNKRVDTAEVLPSYDYVTSSYSDFSSGKKDVITLSSLPVSKRTVVASLSNATALSLSTPLLEGREMIIRCNPSADFTQPIPSTGAWSSMSGESFQAKANVPFEISIWCYESGKYSIAVMGKK